jgi:hypothetical protein
MMIGHTPVERRPLSEAERNLVEWLLAHGGPGAAKYKSQVIHLHVVSMCGCGCPTVDFALQSGRKVGASEIVSEAGGTTPEGVSVGIILHAREGELSELEVYSTSGLDVSFTLPRSEVLEAYDWE